MKESRALEILADEVAWRKHVLTYPRPPVGTPPMPRGDDLALALAVAIRVLRERVGKEGRR